MKGLNYDKEKESIWLCGLNGLWLQFRKYCRLFITNKKYVIFGIFCMIANTLILTTDGLISDQDVISFLFTCNKTFIMIAAIDKVVRFIGLGPSVYFQDRLNAFDTIIVVLSVVELFALSGENSAISAFRSVRLFRIFRLQLMLYLNYKN